MSFPHNSGFLNQIKMMFIPAAPGRNLPPLPVVCHLLIIFSFAALCFFLYSRALDAPFVFDSSLRLTDNTKIRMHQVSFETLKTAGLQSKDKRRPFAYITFAFNYYFHQYRPAGYRHVNIIIHILSGVFLCFFVKRTFDLFPQHSLTNLKIHPLAVASLASLIWLVHPLHTQSVTYVVQRMNSMSGMFYILALLLYVEARSRSKGSVRKRVWLWSGCLTAGALSFLSKENAITLPFLILLYEWYFFQDLDRQWFKRCVLYFLAIAVALAVIGHLYLDGNIIETFKSARDFEHREFTYSQRLLTQLRVVIYYLSLIFYPHPSRLNLDYNYPLSSTLFTPTATFFAGLAMLCLLTTAFYIAVRERMLSFSLFWFFSALAVESSFIPLAVIFEHRTYLPSMLVIVSATILAFRFIRPGWLLILFLSLSSISFSLWTYHRNNVWRDNISLWADTVQKSPGKARPNNNLGNALKDRGRVDEAMACYEKTLALDPGYYKAHNNLANALKTKGRINEAVFHYQESLRLNPDLEEAHNNLGNALVSLEKVDEAIQHFQEAVRIKPDYDNAHYNMARAYQKKGMKEQAITHYLKALEIQPFFLEAHINLGGLCLNSNDPDKAIEHFRAALRINPGFAMGHNNLGIALEQKGLFEEAVEHYRQAVLLKPDYINAKNNLERALKPFQEKSK